MSDLEKIINNLTTAIGECVNQPEEKFPSMVRFGMSPTGSRIYTALNVLRQRVRAEQDGAEIDSREAEAQAEGAAWLSKVSKSVKSNISAQMKGSL